MFSVLQVLTVILVAVAMALSLAHALELPGKMRLKQEMYYAMQPIYYPGFTIGGISEPAGIILTIILLFLTPLARTRNTPGVFPPAQLPPIMPNNRRDRESHPGRKPDRYLSRSVVWTRMQQGFRSLPPCACPDE